MARTRTCEDCGAGFDTLTAKRLHQADDCPAEGEVIDATDRNLDALTEVLCQTLLTCERCGTHHDGKAVRARRDGGTTVEVRFQCGDCGFQNVNAATPGGERA